MKFFVVLFSVVAAASAVSVAIDYLPPVADNSLPTSNYIPPESSEEPATLTDDGYRYKTVRKLKLRLRRDVSEVPSSKYLPAAVDAPAKAATELVAKVISVATPEEDKTELPENGYRYKTVRRLIYRHRRDVNELPANEYLPPTKAAKEVVAVSQPEEVAVVEAEPKEQTELSENGYRYKTVRRLKYRHRRDVNEMPANEYLPPTKVAEEVIAAAQPKEVAVANAEPKEQSELAEDGYRYKTVHRLKYRNRRDVNELPANEYLPPTEVAEEGVAAAQPEEVAVIEAAPKEQSELAEDGYRYKTVRRLKYRHRRDVNELLVNEYLPPTEIAKEEITVAEPISEEVAAVEPAPEENTQLAEDVNELPVNKYLPPNEVSQEVVSVAEPVVKEVAAPEEQTELSEDGYHYKTVRRLKYRHRRDVKELPVNEYIPPTEIAQVVVSVVDPVVGKVASVEAVPRENTELAEDGYRYKTVRRLKYRHRRDVY